MASEISITSIGFLIGMLSGMFGFGGSSISTPLLRVLFYIPPYYALASPFPMTIASSSVASIKYYRESLIDWSIVTNVLIFMIPGSILGAYLTRFISGKILMLLTAIFLFHISIRFILGIRRQEERGIKRRSLLQVIGFL